MVIDLKHKAPRKGSSLVPVVIRGDVAITRSRKIES